MNTLSEIYTKWSIETGAYADESDIVQNFLMWLEENNYIIQNNKYKENRKDGLTEQEGKVMDALVTAWNEFVKLEKTHPNETIDFMDAIHQCQNTLCMRILRRDYPEGYPTYNK